jgi:hypothetical protein
MNRNGAGHQQDLTQEVGGFLDPDAGHDHPVFIFIAAV